MTDETVKPETRSLWIALVSALVVAVGVSAWAGFLLTGLQPDDTRAGLTNIATLGGVAGGLSLAGTAVLSLTGESVSLLVKKFGNWIRGILFGGYVIMLLAAFAAGLGAMFPKWPGAPWLISSTTSFILLGLAVTALFINTAFHWHHSGKTP